MQLLKIKNWAIILSLVFGLTTPIFASEEASHVNNQETEAHQSEGHSEKFNAGNFIFGHINNAHEWHICTYKGHHISIPLPVILYSKTQGLQIFSSSKFHHGHGEYKNFKLMLTGPEKGHVIERHEDGTETIPLDLSISKIVLAMFFSMILLLIIFISIANKYKSRKGHAPKGLQSMIEPLILFVRDDIAKPCIGEDRYSKFMPFLLTTFFFIFINNLLGLIPLFPGGANVTGNISITLTLAVFTFIITTFSSNKGYWGHIFNTPGVPWWLKFPVPLMPIVEIMGVFTKPVVLMIRLFANITAGHIIALGFFSLIFIFGELSIAAGYGSSILSIAFTVFMSLLELLVAFIQAYVFTMLSALYFGMARVSDHH